MVKVKVSLPTGQYYEGWKRYRILAAMVTVVGLAMFPIAVDPMMNADKYRRIQKITEEELKANGYERGLHLHIFFNLCAGMIFLIALKPWSDPFKRPSKMKQQESDK